MFELKKYILANLAVIKTNLKYNTTLKIFIFLIFLLCIYSYLMFLEYNKKIENEQQSTSNIKNYMEGFVNYNQLTEKYEVSKNNYFTNVNNGNYTYDDNGILRNSENDMTLEEYIKLNNICIDCEQPPLKYKLNYIVLDSNYHKQLFENIKKKYLNYMSKPNLTARNFNNLLECYSEYKNMFRKISKNEEDNINYFFNNLIFKLQKNIVSHKISKNENYTKNNVKINLSSNTSNTKNEKLNNSKNKVLDNKFNITRQKIIDLFEKEYDSLTICKSQSNIEMTMPHTHMDAMIMNQSWFNLPKESTFIHELTHCLQRKQNYLQRFDEIYNKWGFIKLVNGINDIKQINGLNELIRNNPDENQTVYVWENKIERDNQYYLIGAFFNSISPSSLGDVSYLAYPLKRGASQYEFYYTGSQAIELSKFKYFKNYFGEINNNYHPNEIIAQYMEFILLDCLDSNNSNNNYHKYINYKAFQIFYNNVNYLLDENYKIYN
jgi:hypothetical protein